MVSLNQINEEVDSQYGPFIVDDVPGGEVVLRNPIRLTKNERQRLGELEATLKQHKGDPNSMLQTCADVLDLVSVGDGGKRLLDEIGDDAPKLMYLIRLYGEATQSGEALHSEG